MNNRELLTNLIVGIKCSGALANKRALPKNKTQRCDSLDWNDLIDWMLLGHCKSQATSATDWLKLEMVSHIKIDKRGQGTGGWSYQTRAGGRVRWDARGSSSCHSRYQPRRTRRGSSELTQWNREDWNPTMWIKLSLFLYWLSSIDS